MIELQCQCGRKLRLGDEMVGRPSSCPACKAVIQVPATAAAEPLPVPGPAGAAPRRVPSAALLHSGCERCGQERPTALVTFRKNIGMLVLRRYQTIQGSLCGPCIDSVFWDFFLITLVGGWWGAISFVYTPFCLIGNLYHFGSAGRLGGRSTSRAVIAGGLVLGIILVVALGVLALSGSHRPTTPRPH